MAVYHDARCRLCRREGVKLMLKGERCLTDKCAVERRGYAPGEHGKGRRTKETNYGLQLREKQKARRIYGVLERQFRNYFHKAETSKGVTGETLLQMLEMRVDNILYRLGLAPSRSAARQIVRHGHITVNGKKVSIPSYITRPGDTIQVREMYATCQWSREPWRSARGRACPSGSSSTARRGPDGCSRPRPAKRFPFR